MSFIAPYHKYIIKEIALIVYVGRCILSLKIYVSAALTRFARSRNISTWFFFCRYIWGSCPPPPNTKNLATLLHRTRLKITSMDDDCYIPGDWTAKSTISRWVLLVYKIILIVYWNVTTNVWLHAVHCAKHRRNSGVGYPDEFTSCAQCTTATLALYETKPQFCTTEAHQAHQLLLMKWIN